MIRVLFALLLLPMASAHQGCQKGSAETETSPTPSTVDSLAPPQDAGAEGTQSEEDAREAADDGDAATVMDAEDLPLPGTPRPTPTVGIEPPDLTSDISNSRIQLILTATAMEIVESDVERVSSAVSIVDQTGTALSFTTRVTAEETGVSNPAMNRTFIELVPAAPLPMGWIRVQLGAIPDGWLPQRFGWAPTSVGGQREARLSVGDSPVLKAVSLCVQETDVEVTVEFSQNVDLGPSNQRSEKLLVTAGDRACEMRVPHDENAQSIDFSCPGGEVPESLRVGFAGLASKTGKSVTLYGGAMGEDLVLEIDSLENSPQGPGCLIHRE